MSIKCLYSLGVMVLTLGMAVVSGCATAADSDQTIYLDPQTGKVIQHPAPQAPTARSSQKMTTGSGKNASSNSGGYKPWQTQDGTRMLSVDPSQTPKERVVRCADGSLRMGSTGRGGARDNNDPETLCGQSAK
ncbi:MAG: hypothetical protein WBL23_01645 [Salinisphaera sp.]|uniref:hypothetical protein n=1 Tax=Salinisphaera sp. TaxID=1914330 RepID=UPI003C7EC259